MRSAVNGRRRTNKCRGGTFCFTNVLGNGRVLAISLSCLVILTQLVTLGSLFITHFSPQHKSDVGFSFRIGSLASPGRRNSGNHANSMAIDENLLSKIYDQQPTSLGGSKREEIPAELGSASSGAVPGNIAVGADLAAKSGFTRSAFAQASVSAAASGETLPRAIIHAKNSECKIQWKHLGVSSTALECAKLVLNSPSCHPVFMFATSNTAWGCRCCSSGATGPHHDSWDLFRAVGDPKSALATEASAAKVSQTPLRFVAGAIGLPLGEPRFFPPVQQLEMDGDCCATLSADVHVKVDQNVRSLTDVKGLSLLRRAAARAEKRLQGIRKAALEVGSKPRTESFHSGFNSDLHLKSIEVSLGLVSRNGTSVGGGLNFANASNVLDENTSWRYVLRCGRKQCNVKAETIFGLVAALESTLPQLFSHGGIARFENLRVEDWPDYRIRGLMVDAGRRFIPKDILLQQVVEGMALVKMNFLHLHLNDYCRFALDLKSFPELKTNGLHEGQYSVQDIREIIDHAYDRGIMVVPEVDLPGHASALLPLEKQGMKFCKPPANKKTRPEEAVKVFDDPAGQSRAVLGKLLQETAQVFGPMVRWFHVGGDEASPTGQCTNANIASLEAFAVSHVFNVLNRTAVAWEELRLKQPIDLGVQAVANKSETVIVAWQEATARGVSNLGHRVIAANLHNHYLDYGYQDHPASNFWYDISAPRSSDSPACKTPTWDFHADAYLGGTPVEKGMKPADLDAAQARCVALGKECAGITCPKSTPTKMCEPRKGDPRLAKSATENSWLKVCAVQIETEEQKAQLHSKLLGGLSAMWTDKYSFIYQCGAAHRSWGEQSGKVPSAALMFSRRFDAIFGRSIAGMIWPRAAVSAAALWHYRENVTATEVDAQRAPWLSDLLRRVGGVDACPPGCTCDELSACGEPYPVPPEKLAPTEAGVANIASVSGDQDSAATTPSVDDAGRVPWECFTSAPSSAVQIEASVNKPAEELSMTAAIKLCFWQGIYCTAIVCSSGLSSDSTDIAPKLCQIRQRSLTVNPGNEVATTANSNDTFVFLKIMDNEKCAPQLAWKDFEPPVDKPEAKGPPVDKPEAQGCKSATWETYDMRFLGGFAGSVKAEALSVVQKRCMTLRGKCRGVTCSGSSLEVARAGASCTERSGTPFLGETPKDSYEVSHVMSSCN
eukprot:TRINITY_DN2319_c0_g1_i1.p1 TRINITY_DN2319_c0_g1~~TRINITY_DN2319_c0_g1_i1.p1  ORF type:complete len:1177 (-),score=107.33 TRINITY_DN2319_c0_g1_i1:103-3633(-)